MANRPFGRLVVLSLLLLVCGLAGAQVRVREVSIRSGWFGLGKPQDKAVSIRSKRGVLVSNGKRVESSKIDALLSALSAPVLHELTPSKLGITSAWIEEQITDPEGWFQMETKFSTASQRALLAETLRSPQRIAEIVPETFNYVKLDDNPWVTVEVVFEDGSTLKAKSNSYYPFLIPWQVGQEPETYNADISRAVASLLGEKFPNKKRLLGAGFADDLVRAAKRSIELEWGNRQRPSEHLPGRQPK